MSMRPAEILRLRLRCDASAPRLARRAVERLDVITSVREEALLVTSELATNAVMHSGSEPSEEIELKAELLSDGVRIAVKDRGRSRGEPALRPCDHNMPGGIGLRVVEALGREWGANRGDGLCVWVELAL
jgi:serine/threonine-protein kinase RsbW